MRQGCFFIVSLISYIRRTPPMTERWQENFPSESGRSTASVHRVVTALLVVLAPVYIVRLAFKWIVAIEAFSNEIDIAR
jgi:hypothetical protein